MVEKLPNVTKNLCKFVLWDTKGAFPVHALLDVFSGDRPTQVTTRRSASNRNAFAPLNATARRHGSQHQLLGLNQVRAWTISRKPQVGVSKLSIKMQLPQNGFNL